MKKVKENKRNEKILNYFEDNNEKNSFMKNKKFNNRNKIKILILNQNLM